MLQFALHDMSAAVAIAGSIGQMLTTVIALSLAVKTFRHQRRSARHAMINESNSLANLVNASLINNPAACAALGQLREPVVGCPDDAVLLMYLNWVHNIWRTRTAHAVSEQVWQDTLAGCIEAVARLRRDQLAKLLCRGYERGFQTAVLARYDALARERPAEIALKLVA